MEGSNLLIEVNPKIMMGKPVIKGTRLTVELILKSLAAGEIIENLLAAHQRLTKDGIFAAIDFANLSETINIDSEIMSGMAVFMGTRVPIKALFDNLESGKPLDDFSNNFPSVKHSQIVSILNSSFVPRKS